MGHSLHRVSLVLVLLLTSALTVWSESCSRNVSCSFGCGLLSRCDCGWTGNNEAAKFSIEWEFDNYYYLSVNMAKRPAAMARYSSPVICAAENQVHSFQFRYRLENGDGCEMTSYVKSGNRRKVLWNSTAFVARTSFKRLDPVDIGPNDEDFQIIIEVEKIKSEGCGEVGIDDFEYKFSKDVTTTPRGTFATVSSPAQVNVLPESPTLQSTLASQRIFPSQKIFLTSSHDFGESNTQEGETSASVMTVTSKQSEDGSSLGTVLGTGVGLAVLIIAIISASVAIVIARKKSKMSSDTRTAWAKRTETTTAASFNERLPDNRNETERTHELSDPDGRITAPSVLGVSGVPVPEPTTQNRRVTSFGDRVNGSSWQTNSQEDYSVLFGPLPREPVTDNVALDTYSHIQRQSEATDVPGDKRCPMKHVAEGEQRSSQAPSREQKATEDAEDDYSRLRASLTTDDVLITNDTYDHLKNVKQANVRDLCSTADVYANVSA